MNEFKFDQSMYDKEAKCINVRASTTVNSSAFLCVGETPKRIRMVSDHTNNWQYFNYVNTIYKKQTPGGVWPIDYHSYYNVDLNVMLYVRV